MHKTSVIFISNDVQGDDIKEGDTDALSQSLIEKIIV